MMQRVLFEILQKAEENTVCFFSSKIFNLI